MSTPKSPLNNSVSKANYSFPKAPRLPEIKTHNDSIYDMPSHMSKRATSMGFGKKYQICRNYHYPSPDQYNKSSLFNLSPRKGVSFGLGREDIKAVSLLPKDKTPGPGAYENAMKQSAKNNYSMRGRDGFPEIFKKNQGPGPGNYELCEDMVKAMYVDSQKKNPQNYSIKPEHRNKQNKSYHIQLGPGKYEIGYDSMGKQFLGNKRTENAYMFPKQHRTVFENKIRTPGPGSYEFFSQFGK